jgi:TatD DNase family protein
MNAAVKIDPQFLLIDTHVHLNDLAYESDRAQVLTRATSAGVTNMIIPNCDLVSLEQMLVLTKSYPGQIFAMAGLHPTYVEGDGIAQLDALEAILNQDLDQFVAIGEIGLDLHWRQDNLAEQQAVLARQLSWALKWNLPSALHSRSAFAQTLEIVQGSGTKGVFHCFSGTVSEALLAFEAGYCIGIGGNVTYKNSPALQTIKEVGFDRVVLETDGPYLAPVPYRGKRNEPAYISGLIAFLALETGVDAATIAAKTTKNALKLFPGLFSQPETA